MTGDTTPNPLHELAEPDAPATLLVGVMARVHTEIDVAAPTLRATGRARLRERLSWMLVGLGILAVTALWTAAGQRISMVLARSLSTRPAYATVDDVLVVTSLLTALAAYMTGVLRLSGRSAERP